MQKKLLKKYNQNDGIIVISTYPEKGKVYTDGGVSSFAKNTVLPMARLGQKVVVLADVLDKPEVYEEEGVLVVRCWERGGWGLYKSLWQEMRRFDQIRRVMVEFEFALYGDFWVTGVMPAFLGFLRLKGRRVVLVMHQVLASLQDLAGHVGMKKDSWRLRFFDGLMKVYYWLMGGVSRRVVVLESEFKRRLERMKVRQDKVAVIEHGVDVSLRKVSRKLARKKLGIGEEELVVLVFGFLSWYKGSDLAVKGLKKFLEEYEGDKKVRMILAGGESVTQKGKKHYQKYVRKLKRMVGEIGGVEITGYVPEEKVREYFSASDVVLMPYRSFMSSSGVLALALAYQKPVVVSGSLKKWFDNEGIEYEGVVSNGVRGVVEFLRRASEDESWLKKLTKQIKVIRKRRDYKVMGRRYVELLEEVEEGVVVGNLGYQVS